METITFFKNILAWDWQGKYIWMRVNETVISAMAESESTRGEKNKRNREENLSTSCKTSLYKATSLKLAWKYVRMKKRKCLFSLIVPLHWCQREWLWTFISQCWGNDNISLMGLNFFYLKMISGFNRLFHCKYLLYTNDIRSKRVFQYEKIVDYFSLKNEAEVVQIFLFVISYFSQTELAKIAKFFFAPLPNILVFLTIVGSEGTKKDF